MDQLAALASEHLEILASSNNHNSFLSSTTPSSSNSSPENLAAVLNHRTLELQQQLQAYLQSQARLQLLQDTLAKYGQQQHQLLQQQHFPFSPLLHQTSASSPCMVLAPSSTTTPSTPCPSSSTSSFLTDLSSQYCASLLSQPIVTNVNSNSYRSSNPSNEQQLVVNLKKSASSLPPSSSRGAPYTVPQHYASLSSISSQGSYDDQNLQQVPTFNQHYLVNNNNTNNVDLAHSSLLTLASSCDFSAPLKEKLQGSQLMAGFSSTPDNNHHLMQPLIQQSLQQILSLNNNHQNYFPSIPSSHQQQSVLDLLSSTSNMSVVLPLPPTTTNHTNGVSGINNDCSRLPTQQPSFLNSSSSTMPRTNPSSAEGEEKADFLGGPPYPLPSTSAVSVTSSLDSTASYPRATLQFDPAALSSEELREELRRRSLTTRGTKPVLARRLAAAIIANPHLPSHRLTTEEEFSFKNQRKEPQRGEYNSEDDYLIAWSNWREARNHNNDSVKKSRTAALEKKERQKHMCTILEQENQTLECELIELRTQVQLLAKVLRNPSSLTSSERDTARSISS